MFIKICGITTIDDAQRAVALGADAIGLVFWPKSPRCIAPAAARDVARATGGRVQAIGVFVDQPADDVRGIATNVGLSAVQLHGSETAEYCAAIGWPVIKSFGLSPACAAADADRVPAFATLLLDRHDPVLKGGTGEWVDWHAAARIARRRPTILAGGLSPENIAAAVAIVSPYGVDVSSGVESSPGVKDPGRLEALFHALRAVTRTR